MNRKKIENIIIEAVKDYFKEENIHAKVDLNTELTGEGSELDSVGIVTVIVGIEENIEDEFELQIILADDRAISHEHSPFKTVTSLANHIMSLVEESNNV